MAERASNGESTIYKGADGRWLYPEEVERQPDGTVTMWEFWKATKRV